MLAALGADATVAAPTLAHALNDEHIPVRVQAAKALVAIGAPLDEALPTIIRILEQEEPANRPELAEAVAPFKPVAEAAVPLLLTMLDDEEQAKLHPAAIHALGKLGPAEWLRCRNCWRIKTSRTAR